MLTIYEKAVLTLKENSKSFSEPRRIFTKIYDLKDIRWFSSMYVPFVSSTLGADR